MRAHLNRYVARNTFDYFIHKDLGSFLRRELDFYIKNEVMHLDDIESETVPRVEQFLSKIKIIRRIAGKIIDFLAQIEDFQKRLWLKKKFVVETQYCVAIGVIPDEFLPEIVANDAQWAEWESLHRLSDPASERSVFSDRSERRSIKFLKEHSTLMVDTQHFSSAFSMRVLAATGDLSELLDGVLFNSENFQALSFLERRYRGCIDCVYIDPPYNTGDSEIPYKNGYLKSSWLALMQNRLQLVPRTLTEDPVVFIAIDDFEMADLASLIDSAYPSWRREMIIVNHHPQGGKAKTLAHTHEYMLTCVRSDSDRTLAGRMTDGGVELRPFKRSGTAESNFRRARPNSFYAILVEPSTLKVVAIEPPPHGAGYSTDTTPEGLTRVYPVGVAGDERVWRRSYESCRRLVEQGKLRCTENMTIYQSIEAHERTAALFSNWVDPRYNAGTFGANLLRDIIGEQNLFAYPKSLHTVSDAMFAVAVDDDNLVVLDFFAGSGTTGHAAIKLTRETDCWFRVILAEMGEHFDTVLLPRLKKVAYTPDWKDGKPRRLATPEEAERSPRIFKVIRLESYEDALNNLAEPRRTEAQQRLLDSAESQGADRMKEQYMLRYLLDVETRGSQSLLNVRDFVDPTAYRLRVKRPGSDESREVHVDLLETFNWLIGLTVRHIAAPRTFAAELERDGERRLKIKGRLREVDPQPGPLPHPSPLPEGEGVIGPHPGPLPEGEGEEVWWFRTVTGTTPEGKKTLVIWRKRPGGDTPEGVERDNLVLDEWFTRQGYSSKDSEFELIYVNGGNNLENLKTPDDTWKVRVIEDDFHRLMFATEEG